MVNNLKISDKKLLFFLPEADIHVFCLSRGLGDVNMRQAVKNVAEALGDTGRILVRESGTEPVVRVMVEAPDHDTCQKYVSEVVDVICEKGYKA